MSYLRQLASNILPSPQFVLGTIVIVAGSSGLLLAGCAVDAAGGEAETAFARTQAAITEGWTEYTSEELPPVVCDTGSVVDKSTCNGRYCDNIALHCVKAPLGKPGAVHYTEYTIGEHIWSEVKCADDEWVTGISCKGAWCGSLSLQCTKYTEARAINCRQAGLFSEETPSNFSDFGIGYYARGVQCSADNCDSVNFEVCQMVAPPRKVVIPPGTVITPIHPPPTLN